MDESQVQPSRRRRRRRSVRLSGLDAFFAHPQFASRLFAAMCVLAVLYAGYVAYKVRLASFYYNSVMTGMSEAEVRYMLGSPAGQDGANWHYADGGRRIGITFGADRHMKSIRCWNEEGASHGCPDILGIRLGTTEDRVVTTLGAPSSETYSGNDKTIHYDGLGLTFGLRRYQVVSMEVGERSGSLGFVPNALWMMVP